MPNKEQAPLLEVKGLKQYFRVSRNFTVKAVDDVSFTIYRSGGRIRLRQVHHRAQRHPPV